jgi:Tfp pilus assembly protein PilZ
MRLITASFGSSQDFLASYSTAHDGGALFYRTRMDLRNSEQVVVEVEFPGLPNRALMRAEVAGFDAHGQGVWLHFLKEAAATRDFVLEAARGDDLKARSRNHRRFPLTVPCNWQIPGTPDRVLSYTDDLGAGGAFVRTAAPPAVGTEVTLTVGPALGDGSMTIRGQVSWVKPNGMGVKFADQSDQANRKIRELLRHASERGRLNP